MCHFLILENAPFSGLKLTSVQFNLGEDLSPNVALVLKSKLFWRKNEWNFGRNCSDLRGQPQSLNGLAHDILARVTLYQSCHSCCSCIDFFPLHSCRLAATAFLSSKV